MHCFSFAGQPCWDLNKNRLLDAWTTWRLVTFYTTTPGYSLSDLDFRRPAHRSHYCAIYNEYHSHAGQNTFGKRWRTHCCGRPGCSLGVAIMDGNAKVVLSKCYWKDCMNLPIKGNQYAIGSPYCIEHAPQYVKNLIAERQHQHQRQPQHNPATTSSPEYSASTDISPPGNTPVPDTEDTATSSGPAQV